MYPGTQGAIRRSSRAMCLARRTESHLELVGILISLRPHLARVVRRNADEHSGGGMRASPTHSTHAQTTSREESRRVMDPANRARERSALVPLLQVAYDVVDAKPVRPPRGGAAAGTPGSPPRLFDWGNEASHEGAPSARVPEDRRGERPRTFGTGRIGTGAIAPFDSLGNI